MSLNTDTIYITDSRRLLKKVSSKAAGSANPETYWTSTLRGAHDRQRSGRPFPAACHV
jgi:hypothetical protein